MRSNSRLNRRRPGGRMLEGAASTNSVRGLPAMGRLNFTWRRCRHNWRSVNEPPIGRGSLLAQLGDAGQMQESADRRIGVGIGVGFVEGLTFRAERLDENVAHRVLRTFCHRI